MWYILLNLFLMVQSHYNTYYVLSNYHLFDPDLFYYIYYIHRSHIMCSIPFNLFLMVQNHYSMYGEGNVPSSTIHLSSILFYYTQHFFYRISSIWLIYSKWHRVFNMHYVPCLSIIYSILYLFRYYYINYMIYFLGQF